MRQGIHGHSVSAAAWGSCSEGPPAQLPALLTFLNFLITFEQGAPHLLHSRFCKLCGHLPFTEGEVFPMEKSGRLPPSQGNKSIISQQWNQLKAWACSPDVLSGTLITDAMSLTKISYLDLIAGSDRTSPTVRHSRAVVLYLSFPCGRIPWKAC